MEKELKKEIFLGTVYLIGALIFINMAMVVDDNIWIVIDYFSAALSLILMFVSVIEIVFHLETRDLSFKAKQRLLSK